MPAGQPYAFNLRQKLMGVNNSESDEMIADNELSDVANYMPDKTGTAIMIKREGLTKASDSKAATTYSVYQGKNANYFHNGTVIYNFAGTSLDTGKAAAYDDWTTFGSYDIVVNGTDARKTSDGASFSAFSTMPSGAKYIASVNNFIYVAGHDKGKLRWGDLGFADSFAAVNELVLTQDENDDIIGLKPWTNSVCVACSKSIYQVTGFGTLDQQVSWFTKTDGHVGSHRGIVVTPYGLFFWSKSGLACVKSDYTMDYPMLRKLESTLNGLNRAYDSLVHGVWDSRLHRVMYFVANGASTTCSLRIDYYPAEDAFWLNTGAAATMSASGAATVSGVADVYAGGYAATNVYLYKVSGNTDDGVAIASYAESKREGDAAINRMGRKVVLTTEMGGAADTVTYSCYVNNETAVQSGNSWALVPGTARADSIIGLNRNHYKIKHKISDSATTRSKIYGMEHLGYVVRAI